MRIGIIGGGPAGYSAAFSLSGNNNKVQLFEKEEVGGVCLSVGCVPTKSLIHSAFLYNICKSDKLSVKWKEIQEKKDLAVRRILIGLKGLFKEKGIEVIKGEAILKEDGLIEVDGKDYEFDKVILAVGSKPLRAPFPVPADVWYSTDALSTKEFPESVVIIGAGYIGLEFGYIFSCFGSKVTIIEKEDEVLPGEDRESAALLRKSLKRRGIRFYFSSEVIEVKKKNGKFKVFFKRDGKQEEIEAEKTIIAVGREPNIDTLPDNILKDNKVIEVNDFLETKIKYVYAVGDCRGGYLLAHSAFKDAEIAVMNILGGKIKRNDFSIPRVIYTEPEFASVGYSEEQAEAENIKYRVSKRAFASNSRAIAMGKTQGYFKLLYGEESNILGGIIVGEYAAELISVLSLAIQNQISVNKLSQTVFPHPTFSEIIGEVSSAALC